MEHVVLQNRAARALEFVRRLPQQPNTPQLLEDAKAPQEDASWLK